MHSSIATIKVLIPTHLASEVTFLEADSLLIRLHPHLQLLGAFVLREEVKRTKIDFYSAAEIRSLHAVNGIVDELPQEGREEELYLIVRSLKNKNNENKGYKLGTSPTI